MEKIAIIGTGISAMGAAFFLKDKFDIVFYEKNSYPGGHTHTLTMDEGGRPVFIDSAFMVYNEMTYPNLTRLFQELKVESKETDMSFSVQHIPSGLEYCGTGLNGLFAQRRNLLKASHWKLLLEIDRFNKEAPLILDDPRYSSCSLKDFVSQKGFSEDFLKKFLIPISSAVWSTPPDAMLKFPAVTLVRFFKNHGFLGLKGHYQWKTLCEGSQRYRDKILSRFEGRVFLNRAAVRVKRENDKAVITDSKGIRNFYDKVILASHADESLALLSDASPLEEELLSKFRYQKNRVTLHTDASVMPQTPRAWSSWNYRIGLNHPSTVYWMNNLQHVSRKKNYFISVNDDGTVDASSILWDSEYDHPVFDTEAMAAQVRLPKLNDNQTTYYCGAYFRYGFHEDGLISGMDVARAITGEPIWN